MGRSGTRSAELKRISRRRRRALGASHSGTEPAAPPAWWSGAAFAAAWPVLALAAYSAGLQWWLVHDLHQLPSAIFGGDWTYQEACIRSILVTSNPLASPASGGGLPGYMPLYGTLVAVVIRLTGLDVERVMLGMSAVNHVASTLLVFFVIGRHFGRRTGLLIACLWTWVYVPLVVKYTEFTAQVLVPFYFDALLRWLASSRARHALYLGLVLALLGYAHAVAFVGGIAIATITTLVAALRRPAEPNLGTQLGSRLIGLAIVAACTLLSLGYWLKPIFVFHGHTSPHYSEWNGGEDVSTVGQRLAFAGHLLERCFPIGSAPSAILSLLTLAGVMLAFRAWRRHPAVVLVSAVTFAWIFHFMATVPLLHTHFIPEYVRSMLWAFASPLLASLAVRPVVERIPAGRAWAFASLAIVGAAAVGMTAQAREISRDPAMVMARVPLPPYWLDMQRWALAHCPRDAVELSANELSYAWCALTGHQAMVSRRAQNDPFLDLDERNRDAAEILYGWDDAKRSALLERWNISYVLWTRDWVGTEYAFLPGGEVSMADPLLYFANPKYDDELQSDSVVVQPTHAWVDPRLRGPEFPQFDLSLISWQNYRALDHPWTDRLDPWLERVWAYRDGGHVIAALYHVRVAPADPPRPGR